MDLGSQIMRSGGLGMPWVWDPGMQGSRDHEGMQTICTTYHGVCSRDTDHYGYHHH